MDEQIKLNLEKKNLINEIEKLKKEHGILLKNITSKNSEYKKIQKFIKENQDAEANLIKNKKELVLLDAKLCKKMDEYTNEKNKIYSDALEEIKSDFENKKKDIHKDYIKQESDIEKKIKNLNDKYIIEERKLYVKLKNEEKRYRNSKKMVTKSIQVVMLNEVEEDQNTTNTMVYPLLKGEIAIQTESVDFKQKDIPIKQSEKTPVTMMEKLNIANKGFNKASVYLSQVEPNKFFDIKHDQKFVFDKTYENLKLNIYSRLNKNLNIYIYNSKTKPLYRIYITILRQNGKHVYNVFSLKMKNILTNKDTSLGSFADKTIQLNGEYNMGLEIDKVNNMGYIKFLEKTFMLKDLDIYWLFTDNNQLKLSIKD